MMLTADLVICTHIQQVYGFGVKDIEITEVAEKAKVAEKAEVAKKAKVAETPKMPERVQGIQMTTRHVIWSLTKKAEVFIKTARHVM
jgi:hypothetical protein